MKKYLIVIIIFLFVVGIGFGGFYLYNQNKSIEDNLRAIETPQEINTDVQYTLLLEKTNTQLNLWYNPLILCISLLGVLFTLAAIIFAFVLYRQSSDYKEKLEEDRRENNKNIQNYLSKQKDIIAKREKRAEEIEDKINIIIEQYKKQFKSVTASQKEEIKQKIRELESQKINLQTNVESVTVTPESSYSDYAGRANFHKCSHCGFGFRVDASSLSMILGMGTVTCPKCGSIETIQNSLI